MNPHDCSGHTPHRDYGDAIDWCVEDTDGRLFVGNDEYSSQVSFCPYCGFRARVAAETSRLPRRAT